MFTVCGQNLRLPNRSRGSRTGPCCLHFWTCASCWICCCPGTGQLTFTITVRTPANTCVFLPSGPSPFWKSNLNCLNRPCPFITLRFFVARLTGCVRLTSGPCFPSWKRASETRRSWWKRCCVSWGSCSNLRPDPASRPSPLAPLLPSMLSNSFFSFNLCKCVNPVPCSFKLLFAI